MAGALGLHDKRVIVSRTDSIGDVILTLPVCAWIKGAYPSAEIMFLGKGYTRAVAEAFDKVDRFIDWNDFISLPEAEKIRSFGRLNADVIIHAFPDKEIAAMAKKAGIPVRVGTSHRVYHLLTCTHRVNFSRKNSALHEAQLNHELLRPFGLAEIPGLSEIIGTTQHCRVPDVALPALDFNPAGCVILHPKSLGSAREWPPEKYSELALQLAERGHQVIFTGTEREGRQFRGQIPAHERIHDSTGRFSLEQLMAVISKAKGLVACSTGPLHIAGFYGIRTVGLFSPRRPIHPGRWKALGRDVHVLVFDEKCPKCARNKECDCIGQIPVATVLEKLL